MGLPAFHSKWMNIEGEVSVLGWTPTPTHPVLANQVAVTSHRGP